MSNASNDLERWRRIEIYVGTTLPIMSVSLSIMYAFFLLFRPYVWSWKMVVYIMAPFILLVVLYLLLVGVLKVKYHRVIKQSKKVVVLLIFLLLVLCGLLFSLWKTKNVQYINMTIENLCEEQEQLDVFGMDYVIYGSRNCIYCSQMKEVYKKVFLKMGIHEVKYVDLSYTSITDEHVADKEIKQLPLLVVYKDGEELRRIEGMATEEMLEEFLQ